MAIGFGIALIVLGAILSFAVKAHISAFDLTTVGYILMGAGLLVLLIGIAMSVPRARKARSTAITTDDLGRQYVTRREDQIDGL